MLGNWGSSADAGRGSAAARRPMCLARAEPSMSIANECSHATSVPRRARRPLRELALCWKSAARDDNLDGCDRGAPSQSEGV